MKRMKKNDEVKAAIEKIRKVEVQGATNVCLFSLSTLKQKLKRGGFESKTVFLNEAKEISQVRSTEPLTVNAVSFLASRLVNENDNWKELLLKAIDIFVSRLGDVNASIVEAGEALIKPRQVILTHCHSSLVEKIIIRSQEQGKEPLVFVTETNPLHQGQITASKLTAQGVSVIMITDSLVPNLLINGYEEKGKKLKIDLVFVGVDALDKSGANFFNKVGTFSVAHAAQVKKIPVFAVSSLLKVSRDKVKIEIRPDQEIFRLKRKNFDAYNPAFDRVPTEFLTGIVTEFGVIKSKKILPLAKKHYPFIFSSNIKNVNLMIDQKNEAFNPYKNYFIQVEKLSPAESLTAVFRLKVKEKVEFSWGAGAVAAESSVGTWTKLKTELEHSWKRLHAQVVEADEKTGLVKVVYPLELFEPDNIPQLLSSVAGNIYGLKEVEGLKLLDLILPEKYVQSYLGPAVGLEGIRKITGVNEGPLVGSIVKPKLGLSWEEHARVAMEVFEGGGNLVKDDENLTNQVFNPFYERVNLVLTEMKIKGFLRQGEERIHAFNATAETQEMLKRANFIKALGGNCAMIDILTAGFAGLSSLRKLNSGLILHGHRAMHAALTRDPQNGISMLVLAKLSRLAGIDELHTGTVVGKMEGTKEEVVEVNNFLTSEWFGLKKVMPVASGGLHPGLVPDLIEALGTNLIMNFGGGIHGHPKGTVHGTRAACLARQAVMTGANWKTFLTKNEDLRLAVELWNSK